MGLDQSRERERKTERDERLQFFVFVFFVFLVGFYVCFVMSSVRIIGQLVPPGCGSRSTDNLPVRSVDSIISPNSFSLYLYN